MQYHPALGQPQGRAGTLREAPARRNFAVMDGPSTPVRVIARLVAQPDKVEQLRALLARAGDRSRAYSECRAWNLLRNRANPREFVSISEWVDAPAYEARMRDAEWIEMTSRLPDLIEGEIGFELYHVIG